MAVDINTISAYTNSSPDTTGRTVSNELGKDEFLNLLVTQLANQDPLEPTSDTEFIAQMAQFSSLEQMQNLNASITSQTAYSLIGKDIVANGVYDAEAKSVIPADFTGNVVGIAKISGTEYLTVYEYDTGDYYHVPTGNVAQVSQGVNVMDQINVLTDLVQKLVDSSASGGETESGDTEAPAEAAGETPSADQ